MQSAVTIKPIRGYFQAQLGDTPLWDAGTLDFALMCARSFLSGSTFSELTGRDILTVDPKTYKG